MIAKATTPLMRIMGMQLAYKELKTPLKIAELLKLTTNAFKLLMTVLEDFWR